MHVKLINVQIIKHTEQCDENPKQKTVETNIYTRIVVVFAYDT